MDTLDRAPQVHYDVYTRLRETGEIAPPLTPLFFRSGNQKTLEQKRQHGLFVIGAREANTNYAVMTTSLVGTQEYTDSTSIGEIWMPKLSEIDRTWHEHPFLGYDRGFTSPNITQRIGNPELSAIGEALVEEGVNRSRIYSMFKGKPLPHLTSNDLVATFPPSVIPEKFISYSPKGKSTSEVYKDLEEFQRILRNNLLIVKDGLPREWLTNSIFQTIYEDSVYTLCIQATRKQLTDIQRRQHISTIRSLPPLSQNHQRWIGLLADALEKRYFSSVL